MSQHPANAAELSPRTRDDLPTRAWPLIHAVAAAAFGFLAGLFHIYNTSIGWHLASGRWILAHRAVPRADPFTFTSSGTGWVDHEWLFQVIVAVVDAVAGVPALVLLRAVLTGGIALLLYLMCRRAELMAPLALVLATACVLGARLRFFLRPEIFTLLLVVAVVGTYLHRRPTRTWPLIVAALTVLAANLHGAAVIIPVILSGALVGDVLAAWRAPAADRPSLRLPILAVAASWLAPLANPFGWKLFAAPLRLAHLVGQPHIPNPEWISPGPTDLPFLYIALIAGALVLAARERHPRQWILFLLTAALAVRYVRNVGFFFVLLPLVLSPALAGWDRLARDRELRLGWSLHCLALALVAVLATTMVVAPWPPFGLELADERYPQWACDYLDSHNLPTAKVYNDVNFGGYLINRYYPERLVFLDDRNEIHEHLLEEMWQIFQRSDQAAWHQLLDRHGVATALVRYHPAVQVFTPQGAPVGERGFSALWFPTSRWALVYWDDVAMVFVRRTAVAEDELAPLELATIRPDDLDHMTRELARGALDRGACARELDRAVALAPAGQRAAAIAEIILSTSTTERPQ